MGMLDGKVALVTGAGGGLGRTHVLLLAAEGAAVVVNDLGGARDGTGAGTSMADGVVEEIREAGGQAVADYGSVADKAQAQGMVQTAVDNFGQLDICICNAGILRDKSFKNMTDDMWEVVNDVHLRGTYYSAKAAYDRMLEQGEGGRIIVTSSTSGLLGNFGQTNYGAAKAGIAGFARCLYLEGARYGVTVNILAPTALSRLTEDILPEQAKDAVPPEKVSPTVVWLCTDDAKDVTGRTWLLTGNRVSLLSWQVNPVAQKDEADGPWD
ncbi:MAG: SDR family NAD(P)-dependent oxidoreductase, partial [Gammaproteobacteria bacterium]|nr:SDR family NAD(P)-dependent oxidoreductase [Gammaproteobacteria bacterium]